MERSRRGSSRRQMQKRTPGETGHGTLQEEGVYQEVRCMWRGRTRLR